MAAVWSGDLTLSSLPNEILFQIFDNLDGPDLCRISQTSWRMYDIVKRKDILWKQLCLSRLDVKTFEPYLSYYEMYSKLFRHLWMGSGIWFGDKSEFGSIVASKYNKVTGTIELYEVHCEREISENSLDVLSSNPMVSVRPFKPHIRLNEDAIIRLDQTSTYDGMHTLNYFNEQRAIYTCILRTSSLSPERFHRSMSLWPPFTIPSSYRTRTAASSNNAGLGITQLGGSTSSNHHAPMPTSSLWWSSIPSTATTRGSPAASSDSSATSFSSTPLSASVPVFIVFFSFRVYKVYRSMQ